MKETVWSFFIRMATPRLKPSVARSKSAAASATKAAPEAYVHEVFAFLRAKKVPVGSEAEEESWRSVLDKEYEKGEANHNVQRAKIAEGDENELSQKLVYFLENVILKHIQERHGLDWRDCK